MKIRYKGTSNFRELGPEDFTKAGVEHGENIQFPKGISVDVPDKLGQALLDDINHLFTGEFEESEADYADLSFKDLKAEIDKRNEDLPEDQHISKAGSADDMRSRLAEHDEAQRTAEAGNQGDTSSMTPSGFPQQGDAGGGAAPTGANTGAVGNTGATGNTGASTPTGATGTR